jgi:predicted Zn-dependent peptidase/outer membrane lipoprotein-sorting protein
MGWLLVAVTPAAAQKHPKQLRYPPLRDLRLPAVERTQLPNGLILYLVEDHTLPKVEGYALVKAGARFEPADRVGLGSIVGQVMRTGGSRTRKGEEIDRLLENVGASVETNIGTELASASLFTLKENLPQVLEILADLLRDPAFPEDKIELAKVQERTGIARRNDDVGGIANREFNKLLYGSSSPYARTTEYATIETITRDDLVAFHRRFFHPNQTILGLWGDFNAAEGKVLVERLFSSWPRQEVTLPPLPAVASDWQGSVNFIPKDDVNQTNLRIGHLGGRFDDPDFYALSVMAEILGGGSSSRMFRYIRSQLGLAYAVSASWTAGYDRPGRFFVFCNTKSESTVRATQEILKEIRRITQEAPTAEELRVAKEGILNSFVFNFDTTGEIVRRLMSYDYFGYPRDFLEKYKVNVEKVTADDVLRAAKSRLQPDKLLLLAVGRQQDFDQPLATLGAVKTIDIAIPPPPAAGVAAASSETLARGKALLAQTLEAVGGAAVRELRTAEAEVAMTVQTPQGAMSMKGKATIALPNRIRRQLQLPFGVITIVFDGASGWVETPQGVQDLPAAQKKDIESDLARDTFNLLQSFARGELEAQFLEQGEWEGKPVNVVLVKDKAGNPLRLVLDAATGTVLKKIYPGQSPFAGPVEVEEIYQDYREVGGLRLPFKAIILHNGKPFSEVSVSSFVANPAVDEALFTKKP